MPFTFSHPAIIFPLCKKKLGLSITGLIMGSIIPDIEFFLKMIVTKNIGHHFIGIFVFDFPVAMLCCFLYHNLIAPNLIPNLPLFLKNKFINTISLNWNVYVLNNKLIVCISIMIGILSHLLWDGFTHFDGIFVNYFTSLSNTIVLFNNTIPIYSLLQVISSIWGLSVLVWVIKKMPNQNYLSTIIDKKYWGFLFLIFSIIFLIRYIALPLYNTFWDYVMALHGSMIYALIIVSLVYKKIQINRQV